MSLLITALTQVAEDEIKAFWRYVADEVRNLHGKDPLRRLLAEAEAAIKAGRDQLPPIMGGARKLPCEQLRQVVLHHREKILPFVLGSRAWNGITAKWMAKTRLATLERVLDSLECRHANGMRQSLPFVTAPEVAIARLESLSGEIPLKDIIIVMAGLIDNDAVWEFLESPLRALMERIENDRAADLPPHTLSTPVMTEPSSNDPAERVEALQRVMTELANALESAAAELREGRLPDASSLKQGLDRVAMELTTLSSELGTGDQTIKGITTILRERALFGSAISEIGILERLRHRNRPDFEPIRQIKECCARTREIVRSAESPDQVAAAMKPLRALRRLVEEEATLDDAQMTDLLEDVRTYFGPLIATAASRGNLVFEENASGSIGEPTVLEITGKIEARGEEIQELINELDDLVDTSVIGRRV